jgi:cell division protein FtsA
MAGSPVVVLDIGASKILCLVGEMQHGRQVKVLGLGSSLCTGLRRSTVIDMPKVVEAIRLAVGQAERSAGLKITGAYVGMAGQEISVHTSCGTVAISGISNPIGEDDVQRALTAAEQEAPSASQTIMHRFVQSYAVDGDLVHNPLWLHGSRLSIEILTIAASTHACTTLQHAAAEAGLDIAGFVLETMAAASAVVSAEEREMGVGLLDIGAGTSDLALFCGPLRHVAEVPFGGDDLTRDLSVVLNISPREAERLKREYGCVCCPAEEADQTLAFRTTAGRTHSLTRQQLSQIIEARQQEIFEFVRRELEGHAYGRMLAAGLILTGGGAQLRNAAQLGEEMLGMPVRVGIPQDVIASDAVQDPGYATAIGLLRFAMDEQAEAGHLQTPAPVGTGILDKLSRIFSFF